MVEIMDAVIVDEIPVAKALDKIISHVFIVDSSGICTRHSLTDDTKDLLDDLNKRAYSFSYKSIQKTKDEMVDTFCFDLRFFSRSQLEEIINKCDFPEGGIVLSVAENCFYWKSYEEKKHGIVFTFGKSKIEALYQQKCTSLYSWEVLRKKYKMKNKN
ncbi:MAG: hypothetical protein AABY22_31915 [Nanoarchaeota archaeon]